MMFGIQLQTKVYYCFSIFLKFWIEFFPFFKIDSLYQNKLVNKISEELLQPCSLYLGCNYRRRYR